VIRVVKVSTRLRSYAEVIKKTLEQDNTKITLPYLTDEELDAIVDFLNESGFPVKREGSAIARIEDGGTVQTQLPVQELAAPVQESEKAPTTPTPQVQQQEVPATDAKPTRRKRGKSLRVQVRISEKVVSALLSATGQTNISDAVRIAISEYLFSKKIPVVVEGRIPSVDELLGGVQ